VPRRDPLGPFLFAITFQDVLIAANSALQEAGGGRVLAFHDDAPIMGPVHALGRCLRGRGAGRERRGLRVQPRKSLLYRVSEHVTVPLSLQGIPLAEEGLVLLGCPLGTPESCEAWRRRWLAESTACLAELGALEDPGQPFVSSGTVSSLALSSGSVYSPPTQLGSAPWRPLTRASGGQSFSSWASTLRTPAAGSPTDTRLRLPLAGRAPVGPPHHPWGPGPTIHGDPSTALLRGLHLHHALSPSATLRRRQSSVSCPATFAPSWDEARALLPPEVLRDILSLRDCSVGAPPRLFQAIRGRLQAVQLKSLEAATATTLLTDARPQLLRLLGHESRWSLLMVDCVPILARGQAHPLSHRHEPPTPLLARPSPAPLHFLGLDPCEPSRILRCASGMATRRAHRAIQLEGAALLRELGVEYSLEDGACSATYHPLLVPDITFSDPSKEPCRRSDFVVADSQGRAARQGLQELRPFTRSEESRPSAARRAQLRLPQPSSPSPSRPSEGCGMARRASSRPFSDSDRRASPTSTATTTMRRGSGTTTHSASW